MSDDTQTLSREDALTLECDDTDEEFALSLEFTEPESDEDHETETVDWESEDQIAAWDTDEEDWPHIDEGYTANDET